jgi:hypothetical protein
MPDGGLRSIGRFAAKFAHAAPLVLGDGWTLLLDRVVTNDSDVADDGLYPLPSGERDDVVPEPGDGDDIWCARTLKLSLVRSSGEDRETSRESTPPEVFFIDPVKAQVRLTDARLTVACSKFVTARGTWAASVPAMALLAAWRYGRAVRRRHGRMLVGHARYEWIWGVASDGVQTLTITVPTQVRLLVLTLCLSGDTDVAAFASELVARIAAYRLATDHDASPDAVKRLRDLTSGALTPFSDDRGEAWAKAVFPPPTSSPTDAGPA